MRREESCRTTEDRGRASELGIYAGNSTYCAFILFVASFLLLLFSGLQQGGANSFAAETEDQVTKIQKAYEGIRDIRGHFVQKSHVKELKRTDTYKGSFFIKPPSMKWDYTGEKAQTIYVNKGRITIYQKKERQVFRSRFDNATYGQAPIALLAGFGDIRKEFDVVSNTANTLVLKPKNPMGNIVRLEIKTTESGFPIKSIGIIDSLSNRVNIILADVKTNTGLKESFFHFTPPKGVAIMEN